MTNTTEDKEFVLGLYPQAKYVSKPGSRGVSGKGFKIPGSYILVEPDGGILGYTATLNEESTWRYAAQDLSFMILRKLER